MKLGAICLIRNEMDVIELFLKHLDALFDEVIILDHLSLDGTSEVLRSACQQRPGWHYYRLTFKQKIQPALMDFFVAKFQGSDLDFLFLLDADEFVLVQSRQELETALRDIEQDYVGRLEWAYGIPTRSVNTRLGESTRLRISYLPSRFSKVVLPAAMLHRGGIKLSGGNHVAYDESGRQLPAQPLARLLHLPIRGESQLIRKTLITAVGLATNTERLPGDSFQYDHFLELIRTNQLDYHSLLQALVIYEHGWPNMPGSPEIQRFLKTARVFRAGDLIITSNALHLRAQRKNVPLEQLLADSLQHTQAVNHSQVSFEIDKENIHLVGS